MADAGAEPHEVERAVDALYAGEPGEFIAGRDRLAVALRRAGRRDDARQVSGLRRPTLAAWAVDHLALRAPDRIDALVSAGERLRRAHEAVVSGGDPRLVHRAAEERRTLIAALADEAVEVLARRGGGNPDAHREEIEATLEAASTNADVAALTRRGRLVTTVPRPAGFAGLLDLPLPQAPAPAPAPEPAGPIRTPAEQDVRRAEEVLERARQDTSRLEQRAAAAAADAEQAQLAVDQALAALERLEAELAEARARAAEEEEAAFARAWEAEARRAAAAAVGPLRRREGGTRTGRSPLRRSSLPVTRGGRHTSALGHGLDRPIMCPLGR